MRVPIPNPTPGEKKIDFMSRCVPAIKGAHPNPKERVAICLASFSSRGKKEKAPSLDPGNGMIALYPSPAVAAQIAQLPSVSEKADDLHITLAYIPNAAEHRDEILAEAARLSIYPPTFLNTTGTVKGAALFSPGDDGTPYVLLIESQFAHECRQALMYSHIASLVSTKYTYTPHMTIGYLSGGPTTIEQPPAIDLVFDAISVVIDGERYDFPIGMGALRAKVDEGLSDVESASVLDSIGASQPEGEMDEQHESKAGRRLAGNWIDKFQDALSSLGSILTWAKYDDSEPDDDDSESEKTITDRGSVFLVEKAGAPTRWIAFSSNGFRDRTGEIIATKALEDAVEKASNKEAHGPLRLYHVDGADVGVCDFQAVHDRFLIESGTFDDTEIGRKALDYVRTTDEKQGVSIGFIYPKDRFDGEVYDGEIRIVERSLAPWEDVCNPWTSFESLEGVTSMNDAQRAYLDRVAGPEFASKLILTAETKTKELEDLVAFRAQDVNASGENSGDAGQGSGSGAQTAGDGTPGGGNAGEGNVSGNGEGTDNGKTADGANSGVTPPGGNPATPGQVEGGGDVNITVKALQDAFAATLNPVVDALNAITKALTTTDETIGKLDERLKSVERTDDDKLAERASPRGTSVHRASSSQDNILVDTDAVAKALNPGAKTSPVDPFIGDLLAKVGR